jgi:hypothetical protein
LEGLSQMAAVSIASQTPSPASITALRVQVTAPLKTSYLLWKAPCASVLTAAKLKLTELIHMYCKLNHRS